MSDLAAIITAGTGALTVLGGGFTWVWREVKDIRAGLAACEKRERNAQEREGKLVMVIELLWQVVPKTKMTAATLARCEQHLDDLKAMREKDKTP